MGIKAKLQAESFCSPLKLKVAKAWRTGTGGKELDRMLGVENPEDSHFPEYWLMSTVAARNIGREEFVDEGLSYFEDYEETLAEAIKNFPNETMGAEHISKIGTVPGVLAKIIDTAERTTIQVHPDKDTAQKLFNSAFGKTESWHILGVRQDAVTPPGVYIGFKEGITREYWKKVFDEQDIPAMLNCLHFFPVTPGETYIIRAGVPHAVSADFMFLEMQEPTDFTIRTERVTTKGFQVADYMCHQGLGFDTMFECFHYDGISKALAEQSFMIPRKEVASNEGYTCYEVVGYDQTNCFKLLRYEIKEQATIINENVASGLVVFSGKGKLLCDGTETPVKPGDQFFLSYHCKDVQLIADEGQPLVAFRTFGPKL